MSPRVLDELVFDKRREDLLATALEVFARQGLAATRIQDIAREAKISSGLLYHYFANKDDIFTILVERAMESSSNSFVFASESTGEPAQKLLELLNYILGGAYRGKGPYYFLIMIQASTFNPMPQAVEVLLDGLKNGRYYRGILDIIVEGQSKGQFVSGDPKCLLNLLFAIIQGLAVTNAQGLMELPKAEYVIGAFLTKEGRALLYAGSESQ